MRLLVRLVLWLWRRLSDAQTLEWIYQGGLSLAVSTITTWLWARLGALSGSELLGLAVVVFMVALPGFRLWRSRHRRTERARLFLRPPAENSQALRDDLPPAPPGVQPEYIRRDLGRLITEGEDFVQRGVSLSARSMLDRMVPQGIWDFYVLEWRNRTLGYFKDAGLDGGRFAECSPPEAKTLTLEQLRCHMERLRESL